MSSTDATWNFSLAPESKKLKFNSSYGHFINGSFLKPEGKLFPVINPATEQEITRIPYADAATVNRAFVSARKSYERYWKKTSGLERGKYLYKLAEQLQGLSRDFAEAESLNTGKPIRESKGFDIPLSIQHCMYYAGWADKWKHVPVFSNRKPYGVAAQIIPWNFPLWMAIWKIAPALACGNTVVLKPAETTPLTALMLAKVIQECDFPPGVFNLLLGDGKTGKIMLQHPEPDKIAFTGSTEVGKHVQQEALKLNKGLSLELGGKGPQIIFEDATLSEAIEGVIKGIFFNQGQVCCAGSRVLIHESVAEAWTAQLKKRISKIRIGDPMDKNTEMGSLHSKVHYEKVMRLIKIGKSEKQTYFEHPLELPKAGYFCKPTVFTNMSSTHSLSRTEIFGPVLTLQTFRSVTEAIQMANNTPYGLSAGIWTTDMALANAVSRQIQSGVVWLNCFNVFDPAAPFGGYKESGFGREGGLQGLGEYLK